MAAYICKHANPSPPFFLSFFLLPWCPSYFSFHSVHQKLMVFVVASPNTSGFSIGPNSIVVIATEGKAIL